MKALKIFLFFELIVFAVVTGGFLKFFKESKRTYRFQPTNSENKKEANFLKTAINEKENPVVSIIPKNNFCDEEFFGKLEEKNKKFCERESKLTDEKGIEINLSENKALLYENKKLIKILPLAYQAPEDKWFQSPTGYYRIGVKKKSHLSSIFPVKMPYAVQYYEDFFLHGIPFFNDNARVSSDFTGGCLRFEDKTAKEIYDFLKTDDQVVVYKTLENFSIKPGFSSPLKFEESWIRQRFNNPYRSFFLRSGNLERLKEDYYEHTGVDFALNFGSDASSVYAVYDGKVAKIQVNDGKDHGLGNVVILKHEINGATIYSLYAHLDSIKENLLREGTAVKNGEEIGKIGDSGNGCRNYWRIGPDGCNQKFPFDTHLHFEIKTAPVLENPVGGEVCKRADGSTRFCFGYTPDYPKYFGYSNPIEFLFEKKEN